MYLHKLPELRSNYNETVLLENEVNNYKPNKLKTKLVDNW